MMDLTTKLCGTILKNPTVLASGIMGVSAASLLYAERSGAGALTTKSIGPVERTGHPNPVVITYPGGMLNAVGLSNEGIDLAGDKLSSLMKEAKSPVIVSVLGSVASEYAYVARIVDKLKPALIELNISCPNVDDQFGKPFSCDQNMAQNVTRAVKAEVKTPVSVKLTANVSDIVSIAKAVAEAGADCITAINTVGPGMAIDPVSRKPILANKRGGMSGPAIKPLAIRCVYDIYETVDIPIIGVGGVTTGEDAIEMMMAGATAVGIGSAVYYRGIDVFSAITKEMEIFMRKHGISKIKEIIGAAH